MMIRNYAHFIITFFGFPALFWLSLKLELVPQIAVVFTIVLLLALHGLNESFQAIDKNLTYKYGSWKNFQKDSKKDWKQFFTALFISMILTLIIYNWMV